MTDEEKAFSVLAFDEQDLRQLRGAFTQAEGEFLTAFDTAVLAKRRAAATLRKLSDAVIDDAQRRWLTRNADRAEHIVEVLQSLATAIRYPST